MAYTLTPPQAEAPTGRGGFVLSPPRAVAQEAQIDPTEGMSGLDKFLAGTGKAFVDIARGAGQLAGIVDQGEIDDAKARDAALMRTGAGLAGNVAGNVAASLVPAGTAAVAARGLAAIPQLARVVQAIEAAKAAHPFAAAVAPGTASGALMGALEPVATGESRMKNVALNAGAGAIAAAAPRAVARIVRPETDDAARALIDEGVRLTPGQVLGGGFKAAEEKLSSVPLLGDIIKGAQRRGIEDFNRAAFNRALEPIGEKVGRNFEVGHKGIAEVERMIGNAYERTLDKIGRVDLDAAFRSEVGRITDMALGDLGEANAKQFGEIVKNEVIRRMTPAGTMSADTMKIVESELGRRAAGFAGSAEFNNRQLGAALREVQASLRRAVERSAGQEAAGELSAANKAWSEFVRIRDAAGRIGSKDGVFTPAQFAGAVRAKDKSVGKGAFARGEAIGQDLAEAGRSTLSPTVPDSGTAGRLLAALTAGGGPVGLIDPTIAATVAAGSLPYTSLGQRLTLAALAKRPEQAAQIAELLRAGSMPAGLVGAGMGMPSLAGP